MTSLGLTKEILGVDNAHVRTGTVNTPARTQQAAYCPGSSLTLQQALAARIPPAAWFIVYVIYKRPRLNRPSTLLQGPLQHNEEPCSSAVRRGYCACGSGNRPRTAPLYHILVTLCRFDHKYPSGPYLGPFIPCERRLPIMEILEFKVVVFEAGF